jgi:PKD repeat protein
MRHAKRAAGFLSIVALTLVGCEGSCQRAGESAPGGEAAGKAVQQEQGATAPGGSKPTVAEGATAKEAPTPPKEIKSDCFVFVDAEPDYGDAPLTAHFTTEVECGNKPVTYSWDFGDGTSGGNEANPSHTYSKEGDYIAVVTVKTADGEEGTDEIDIFVDAPVAD